MSSLRESASIAVLSSLSRLRFPLLYRQCVAQSTRTIRTFDSPQFHDHVDCCKWRYALFYISSLRYCINAKLASRIFRKLETAIVQDLSFHLDILGPVTGRRTHPLKTDGERGEDKTEDNSHHGTGCGSSPPMSEVTR